MNGALNLNFEEGSFIIFFSSKCECWGIDLTLDMRHIQFILACKKPVLLEMMWTSSYLAPFSSAVYIALMWSTVEPKINPD